ncbi:MAG: SGNH/GDSL hydrolase family protein [Gallionella sp.]
MSLLLAGMTVLMIGDSHMATKGYLISSLHDELMQQGAKVYSYGACGTLSGDWMRTIQPPCGGAFRLNDKPLRVRAGEAASTTPLPDLVREHHPDLIVVINGDTMAGYKSAVLPRPWISKEVSLLTHGIKASGVSCVWVGPAWGNEGGKNGKNFPRVKEMSDFLAENVAPCTYINSLNMSKPGEWGTLSEDGQHFTDAGYQSWGSAIAKQILSSDVLQKIKH